MLPELKKAQKIDKSDTNRLLIISEGFEARSLSWINLQDETTLFQRAVICKYEPTEREQYAAMLAEVTSRTSSDPKVVPYNRFNPSEFELSFKKLLPELVEGIDEIVIDISAMSKLLIMIILYALKACNSCVRIIYTEPKTWSPSFDEYERYIEAKRDGLGLLGLSSVGVYDIIRTPNLSSIAMQRSPAYLITFTSTNENLINILLNEVTPIKAALINSKNDREPWREEAAVKLYKNALDMLPLSRENLICFDLLDYKSVFEYLAQEYRRNCYNKRIVIAPIGGKIHTVACALLKNCCPDVHIEYPTPESYLFNSYSSAEIIEVYELKFDSFSTLLISLSENYMLNG